MAVSQPTLILPGGVPTLLPATSPGAGADLLVTCPVGSQWELLAFTLLFVTSAAVANRTVRLEFDNGSAASHAAAAYDALIPASTTIRLFFSRGFSKPFADAGGNAYGPIPHELVLYPGWRIRSVTGNIQAGDQYSQLQLMVR